MATSKGQGSGVTFTPDATYAGPYNYTRADIPIYNPAAASSGGGGAPTTTPDPTKPPKTPQQQRQAQTQRMKQNLQNIARDGAVRPIGNRLAYQKPQSPLERIAAGGAVRPIGNRLVNNPVPDNSSLLHQRGTLPKMPVNQTGTGMALGGAGRGLNAMPRARAPQAPAAPSAQWQDPGFDPNRPPPPLTGTMPQVQPPMSMPAPGSIQNPIARYPAGSQPPMPMPRQRAPIQTVTVPSTGSGGMPTSVPRSAPATIGNASPGQSGMAPPRTGQLPNGRPFPGQSGLGGTNPMQAQQRTRLANALAGPARPPMR